MKKTLTVLGAVAIIAVVLTIAVNNHNAAVSQSKAKLSACQQKNADLKTVVAIANATGQLPVTDGRLPLGTRVSSDYNYCR